MPSACSVASPPSALRGLPDASEHGLDCSIWMQRRIYCASTVRLLCVYAPSAALWEPHWPASAMPPSAIWAALRRAPSRLSSSCPPPSLSHHGWLFSADASLQVVPSKGALPRLVDPRQLPVNSRVNPGFPTQRAPETLTGGPRSTFPSSCQSPNPRRLTCL